MVHREKHFHPNETYEPWKWPANSESCVPQVCFDHQALVTDETRVAPYAAAIRGVAAGRKVLDIGWVGKLSGILGVSLISFMNLSASAQIHCTATCTVAQVAQVAQHHAVLISDAVLLFRCWWSRGLGRHRTGVFPGTALPSRWRQRGRCRGKL